MTKDGFIVYKGLQYSEEESLKRSRELRAFSEHRRSVRDFSNRSVPLEIMKELIRTAATAPSGANKQPWTFCLVGNPELKSQIRTAAEQEEQESYTHRMSDQWLKDLAPLGTDWHKPFLETAPWLIVVFKRVYEEVDGEKWQNYYVSESVGIACGLLINAIHHAGLVTLTHTPSPMGFLSALLKRPANERPFLLMPVGYPTEPCLIPDLNRKSLEEVAPCYQ